MKIDRILSNNQLKHMKANTIFVITIFVLIYTLYTVYEFKRLNVENPTLLHHCMWV